MKLNKMKAFAKITKEIVQKEGTDAIAQKKLSKK